MSRLIAIISLLLICCFCLSCMSGSGDPPDDNPLVQVVDDDDDDFYDPDDDDDDTTDDDDDDDDDSTDDDDDSTDDDDDTTVEVVCEDLVFHIYMTCEFEVAEGLGDPLNSGPVEQACDEETGWDWTCVQICMNDNEDCDDFRTCANGCSGQYNIR